MNRKLIIFMVLVCAIVALRFSPLNVHLTFENFVAQKEMLKVFVRDYYVCSALLFIASYILVIALSLPIAVVMTLAGGVLFGTLATTLYVNVGATLGSVCVFVITRCLIGDWVQRRYGVRLKDFNTHLHAHGYNYLLTLRLIPIFPFFLINLAAAVTKIPLYTFAWTTMLGIIPGTAVYAFAGTQLDTIQTPGDVFSVQIIGALALLVTLALIPVIYNMIKK